MIIITDTSPINYLVLIREIELLPKLFGKVVIPQAVLDELKQEGTPEAVKNWLDSNQAGLKFKTLMRLTQQLRWVQASAKPFRLL